MLVVPVWLFASRPCAIDFTTPTTRQRDEPRSPLSADAFSTVNNSSEKNKNRLVHISRTCEIVLRGMHKVSDSLSYDITVSANSDVPAATRHCYTGFDEIDLISPSPVKGISRTYVSPTITPALKISTFFHAIIQRAISNTYFHDHFRYLQTFGLSVITKIPMEEEWKHVFSAHSNLTKYCFKTCFYASI